MLKIFMLTSKLREQRAVFYVQRLDFEAAQFSILITTWVLQINWADV